MPEIESITVKGYKSIAVMEKLPLNSINVIIGPNGSGKSNFIGVFSFLRAIRLGHLQDYVAQTGGAEKILHLGSKVTDAVFFELVFESQINTYRLTLQPTDSDELIPFVETAYYWDQSKYPDQSLGIKLSRQGKEAGISETANTGVVSYVQKHMNSWRLYHFHDTSRTSPLKKSANINDNRYLRPDGSNLAAFLYVLRKAHPGSYNIIRDTVRQITPFFDDFVLEPQKLNSDNIRLEWRHKHSDDYFDASSFSDGSLRFIALCTLFLQPKQYRPSVILVDEPELGLHPSAIELLASLVKSASIKTQVILATQSSILIDYFEPEHIIVADLENGGTKFTRLDKVELAGWLEDYSLGQLWEKNEIGGRP